MSRFALQSKLTVNSVFLIYLCASDCLQLLLLLSLNYSPKTSCNQSGKPRGRQTKVPKHTVDSGGVINISDDSSSDSDGIDTDSNSSPDSLLDNDDVIFVNHTSCQTGREIPLFLFSAGVMCEKIN